MQSFIRVEFDNFLRPTVYCMQDAPSNMQNFNCLIIFPSGVPNSPFDATFSFDHNGWRADTEVEINPLRGVIPSRRGRVST